MAAVLSVFVVVAWGAEPDFSKVPGVIIDHIPASEGRYVGSPTIVILPDGSYVAAHDEFGPKSQYHTNAFTDVFRSEDRGASWKPSARFEGGLWSTLFAHGKSVYIIGTNKEYGPVLIRRSDDGGKTWTTPTDYTTGILAPGEFHTAPVPVVEYKGRFWRGFENAAAPGGWGERYCALVLSAPVDADLLRADSWTFTNILRRDPKWINGTFKGWLEGNFVPTPKGDLYDVLRTSYKGPEQAAFVRISKDGTNASFEPTKGFHELPGAAKKFLIRYDAKSKRYWMLSNPVLPAFKDREPGSVRNTLALSSSRDMKKWTIHEILLYHPDIVTHAFQYPDWVFDGDDIAAVSRTAYDDGLGGATRAHDANFMTFHRVKNFRALQKKTADLENPVSALQ